MSAIAYGDDEIGGGSATTALNHYADIVDEARLGRGIAMVDAIRRDAPRSADADAAKRVPRLRCGPSRGPEPNETAATIGLLAEADDGLEPATFGLGKPTLYRLSYVREGAHGTTGHRPE